MSYIIVFVCYFVMYKSNCSKCIECYYSIKIAASILNFSTSIGQYRMYNVTASTSHQFRMNFGENFTRMNDIECRYLVWLKSLNL